jgi:hypothetical protein
VRFAVLLPVAGILRPPLLRTVIADLTVNRICGNLAAMIFSTAPPLALRRPTNRLLGMEFGKAEKTLTELARPLKHSSRVEGACF